MTKIGIDSDRPSSRFVMTVFWNCRPELSRKLRKATELMTTPDDGEIPDLHGLQGNFSNHSGKRTYATSLFHEGFDEQMIPSRTGHTAIREYKEPSDEQQFALLKILDPPTANMVSTMTLHDTDGDSDERRA